MGKEINYKITPPDGYIIDREKSTLDNIIFKPICESGLSKEYIDENIEELKNKYYEDAHKDLFYHYGYDKGGNAGKNDSPYWIDEYITRRKSLNLPVTSESAALANRWHIALDVIPEDLYDRNQEYIDKLCEINPEYTRSEISQHFYSHLVENGPGIYYGYVKFPPKNGSLLDKICNFLNL